MFIVLGFFLCVWGKVRESCISLHYSFVLSVVGWKLEEKKSTCVSLIILGFFFNEVR